MEKETKENSKKLELIEYFQDENMLQMDGYDDCIVGVVEQFGRPPIMCYDKEKVLQKLVSEGLTHDEAIEFFDFNQIGCHMGEYTPCFITLLSKTI